MGHAVVVARARARPGHEPQMEQALRENADVSRREPGCISYRVLRGGEGVFMTVERWRSRIDVDQHMSTPHVAKLLGTIAPLLAEPPVIEVTEQCEPF